MASGAGAARVDVLDNDRGGVTRTVIWSADMTVVDYDTGAIRAASADLFANTESTEGLEAQGLWYFTPTWYLHAFPASSPVNPRRPYHRSPTRSCTSCPGVSSPAGSCRAASRFRSRALPRRYP